MKKLKVLDLFSGIGGFSLGLERTGGFETAAFCEYDKDAQKVLKKHWPKVPIFKNILDVFSTGKGVTDLIEEYVGEIFLCTGGFPCQDISVGGKRKGIVKGTRSSLWKEYWRIINEVRPEYAIIENVSRLHKDGLGVVLNDLASIGYDAEWSVITANSVGYPHQRERLFVISYPSGKRQYEYFREGRQLQVDEKREIAQTYCQGEKCEPKSISICPILSKGAFDRIRNTYPDERAALSEICRVTDGVPVGVDEYRRKQRVKQLGNSIVPRIAETIGRRILEIEGRI